MIYLICILIGVLIGIGVAYVSIVISDRQFETHIFESVLMDVLAKEELEIASQLKGMREENEELNKAGVEEKV